MQTELGTQILDGVSSAERGTPATQALAVPFAVQTAPKLSLHHLSSFSCRTEGYRNSLYACVFGSVWIQEPFAREPEGAAGQVQ